MPIIKENALAFCFFQLIWRRKSSLLIILLVSLFLGVYARLGYQQFLYLQAQNMSGLSVFNEIILPLAGLALACQVFMSLLSSAQLYPSFFASGQGGLLQQSSLNKQKMMFDLIFPIFCFGLWPIFNFCLICILFCFYTDLDPHRLLLSVFGLLLINGITSFIFLTISLKAKNLLLSIIQSLLIITLLIIIEISLSFIQMKLGNRLSWRGIFLPFITLREGLIVFADIISYLGWLILSAGLCYRVLSNQQKKKKAFFYLLIAIGFIFISLSGNISGQLDISIDQRSSLAPSLINKLNNQEELLEITAVIDQETSRDEIMRGLRIIQQEMPETKIHFESMQSLGPEIQDTGEYLQFKLGTLNQRVSYPFEKDVKLIFEATIEQLLIRKKRWITFIEGHDEASIFAQKNSDLTNFYKALTGMGWPVVSQSLITQPIISNNTGLLVIASSKNDWLPSEEDIVNQYLQEGGNLLLLCDPDSIVPSSIEKIIGISRLPGTLVDWKGFQSGTPHPAVVIVNTKSNHIIAKNIRSFLAFPWTSGLTVTAKQDNPEIFFEPIITTDKNVWSEFEINQEQLAFDENKGELQQAFVLAMSRYNSQNNQKIVVVGDSHFASDSAINNYANKQFALNLINWLNIDDAKNIMDMTSQSYPKDRSIAPTPIGHFMMKWLFSFIFPLFILLFWLLLFWRRNQQVN